MHQIRSDPGAKRVYYFYWVLTVVVVAGLCLFLVPQPGRQALTDFMLSRP